MTTHPDRTSEKGATVVEYGLGAAAIIIPVVIIFNILQGGVTDQIRDDGARVGTPVEVSNETTP